MLASGNRCNGLPIVKHHYTYLLRMGIQPAAHLNGQGEIPLRRIIQPIVVRFLVALRKITDLCGNRNLILRFNLAVFILIYYSPSFCGNEYGFAIIGIYIIRQHS